MILIQELGKLKTEANMVPFTHPRTGESSAMSFVEPGDINSELNSLFRWCSENEGNVTCWTFSRYSIIISSVFIHFKTIMAALCV
jgi:hypothetical protein